MRKPALLLLTAMTVVSAVALSPSRAQAACNPNSTVGALTCGANDSAGVPNAKNPGSRLNNTVENIINLLTSVVGVVAVVMIVVSGFKYVTSNGSSEKVSSAKNTMIFAIVGLIIAALAQVIVRFVLKEVT